MNNRRLRRLKPKIAQVVLLVTSYSLLVTMLGCEAFVRKFTRKPKKENLPLEEMVIAPQEYKGEQMSKEELYRQYLLYWNSWQAELIESLVQGANHKRQISCADEAIKNLEQLKILLREEKQQQLDTYLNQLKELKNLIIEDVYGSSITANRLSAERIKRNILRGFSYAKIKDSLI